MVHGLKRKLPGAGTAMRQQNSRVVGLASSLRGGGALSLAPNRTIYLLRDAGGCQAKPRDLSSVRHENDSQDQAHRRRCGTQSKGARGGLAARAPAAHRRDFLRAPRCLPACRPEPAGTVSARARLLCGLSRQPALTLTARRLPKVNTIVRCHQRRRRPRGGVRAPERPGSLQYHAPSSVFTGHRRREGTGVLARLLARAELHPQRHSTHVGG